MRFDEGRLVGEHARRAMGEGINLAPGHDFAQDAVVQRTAEAIAEGKTLLFEPGFTAGGGSVRADILHRDDAEAPWRLIEVKSSKWPEKDRDREKKFDLHVPDVAVQAHVAKAAELPLGSSHLMYLNPDCRHPDLSNLFTTVEVSGRVEPWLSALPGAIAELHRVVQGDVPDVPVGDQCVAPEECPFFSRCHEEPPPHHVTELYYAKRKDKEALISAGKSMIRDLDESDAPNPAAKRQVRAIKAQSRVVVPGLKATIDALKLPIIHMDFETVQLAVPRWPRCGPQDMVAIQFSVHRERPDGTVEHIEHLAERGGDPRPGLIRALIEACAGAGTVLVYYEQFEKSRLKELAAWFPENAPALNDIHDRIVDLLPIVRDHVYDPDFRGSFSLKNVLPALVPGLDYKDLKIQDGGAATAAAYRILFDGRLAPDETAALRRDLLAYCRRDTEAMVRLLGVLRTIAT